LFSDRQQSYVENDYPKRNYKFELNPNQRSSLFGEMTREPTVLIPDRRVKKEQQQQQQQQQQQEQRRKKGKSKNSVVRYTGPVNETGEVRQLFLVT